jgi:hypothetical protein
MVVSNRLSWLTNRGRAARRGRHRRLKTLSRLAFGDWLLEDRCLLSTFPTIPAANITAAGLSLSSGQTRIIDVSTTPVLDLDGDLNNQGTIYLVSTNPLVHSVSISARNIVEGAGAMMTTVLPADGLEGYGDAIGNLSLTLIASGNFVNNGVITSAGDFTALTGGSITNAPAAGASAGSSRVQAAGEVNLLAPSIVNRDVVASTWGDVDFAVPSLYASIAGSFADDGLPAALPADIHIDNTYGTVSALNGTIRVGGTEFGQEARLSLSGGDLAARAIDVQAGKGEAQVALDHVTGAVSLAGGSAHFASNAGVLNLGSVRVDGDPTFFNAGDIVINGDITVGQSLAILATGNITASRAVVIQAKDPLLGGQNIVLVAGGNLVPSGSPTGSPAIPPGTALLPGQTIRVDGGSLSGGSISLANSTIDTRPLFGNQAGGGVTLIAYGGGIRDVNITSGGAGTGANGGVTLIAGGRLGSTDTAISGIAVNASGGTGKPPADVSLFAAQPIAGGDGITFDASGAPLGGRVFTAGTPTSGNIILGQGGGIISDGGTITIKTGGLFSSQEVVNSSSTHPGGDAGDITIIAGSIDLQAPLLAVGADGANGSDAVLGMLPNDGGGGGKGGMISLEGTRGIAIHADIRADAGNGGKGGNATGLDGAAGALGGDGGMAGTISLSTTDAAITQAAGLMISAVGGSGGTGGDGGDGGRPVIFTLVTRRGPHGKLISRRVRLRRPNGAGNGGAGGNGGMATAGGSLRADAGAGSITFAGVLNFNGGTGGVGGGGGDGGNSPLPRIAGGIGGATGISQDGGMGGMVSLKSTTGAIRLGEVFANGGAGGSQTATSGRGGRGGKGGDGGAVANAGSGAQGGQILLLSTSGVVTMTGGVHLNGGAGGVQASRVAAGAGGIGLMSRGGNGGTIGNGGDGAIGGLFSVTTAGDVIVCGTIDADGGEGGRITSTAGRGGIGREGGFGGDVGNAGGGASGGSVSLTSRDGDVIIHNPISAVGGSGGTNSATAGDGGRAIAKVGGRGGSIGSGVGGGGGGGMGGSISISSGSTTAAPIPITILDQLRASGGAGGALTGQGGDGGNGRTGGGAAGGLLNAGGGGFGGSVLITGKDSIDVRAVDVSGGAGGGLTGNGGTGGDGRAGGDGGGLGASGGGGFGGSLTIVTSQVPPNRPETIVVTFNDIVNADGGAAGIYTGTAGNGGDGSNGNGGNGGAAGSQGDGGGGGGIGVTALSLYVKETAALTANGGSNGIHLVTPGYHGTSGDGGKGGGDGSGGDGGRVGDAGGGGGGGSILLKVPGALTVAERKVNNITVDSIAARGGSVSDDDAVSGNGGDAGRRGVMQRDGRNSKGGDSGDIGKNGSAGRGGEISITGGSGDMGGIGVVVAAGGRVSNMAAQSGNGGDAGLIGRGGRSGNISDNGSAGAGGSIIISSTSGTIGLSPLIVAGGDVDGTFRPRTGDGGRGGREAGSGGSSGNIGNNGNGGDGGLIKLTSESGNILGIGTVLQEAQAIVFVAAGGVVAPIVYYPPTGVYLYSPSQARTGNGGDAFDGNGGSSGNIGNNGSGGKGGEVTLVTTSGNIISPRGGIVTAGGDGGTAFNQTGDGGSTTIGIGGGSGNIGANSNGGDAGPITLKSMYGNVTVGGALILRGAIASNSGDRTGDGGSAKINGKGGSSGTIGGDGKFGFQAGGTAGNGGKLTILVGGSITVEEGIIATGGDAGAYSPLPPPGLPPGKADPSLYLPRTGNGGNGKIKGGDAGNIGMAGVAGKGGEVVLTTASPLPPPLVPPVSQDIILDDRILVNGGRAGHDPSVFPGVAYPAGDGAQRGIGGNGGGGNAGGNGGEVGAGVVGGDAGKIQVSSAAAIARSVDFRADGGNGGDQAGSGGQGGLALGLGKAGNGGSVGASGNAGDAGTILLEALKGVIMKEAGAIGGNGGNNTGKAGNGGDGLKEAGDGGMLSGSGNGGKGGTLSVKTPPFATTKTVGQIIDIEDNNLGVHKLLSFNGGKGGTMAGSAGNGGNGRNKPDVDSLGGNGGKTLDSGAGGQGGAVTLYSPNGAVVLLKAGITVNGGDNGAFSATSGNGGRSTGSKPGGNGGDSGGQGDAGGAIPHNPRVMTITIETGSFTLNANASLTADGGTALSYQNTPGDGGDGGGKGGAGGIGGKSGGGGLGGTVQITTSNALVIEGLISANGGRRDALAIRSGNGGDAGAHVGSAGGDGGGILRAGSGGGGGSISLTSDSDVTGDGSLVANGGGVINGPLAMLAGDGGKGGLYSAGGNGGSIDTGPGTGEGGGITVEGATGVTLRDYMANGGVFFGNFEAVGGKGGDEQAVAGQGGNGGNVEGNGDGGKGGTIILKSDGPIAIGSATATGSSVGNMSAVGGKGGDQIKGDGQGGQGGSVGNNGSGGKGGTIKILSKTGTVTAAGPLNISGGSVGNYVATSGDGGNSSSGKEGIGGASGKLGSNGIAGDGGEFTMDGADDLALARDLLADGGGVGTYFGKAGKGGNAKGNGETTIGGDGPATFGDNGRAGAGGTVTITTAFGAISTQSISASGGKTSAQQASGGEGGAGGRKGGSGGNLGGGTAGGSGGKITLKSKYGNITLNGDLRTDGSAGGDVNAIVGNGGDGIEKGGDGGTLGAAGAGGPGGTIIIEATNGEAATKGLSANGGNGGNLSGKAGDGGDSTDLSAPASTGGNGGNVGPAGNGGRAGTIEVTQGIAATEPANHPSPQPGARGVRTATPGQGGKGKIPGQPGRFLFG